MNVDEVLAELRKRAKPNTAAIYLRHGAENPLGVSFAELEKIRKQIKRDHALARELWETNIMEARTLAAFIADPAQMSSQQLDAWVGELTDHTVVDAVVAHVVAKGPHGLSKLPQWTRSSDEHVGRAGWVLLAHFANDNPNLPDSFFEPYLDKIVGIIHKAPNRKKEAMNMAMIAIGGRSEALAKKATITAKTVGPIDVDHGDTSCKTPDAVSYIQKMWARKRSKAGKSRTMHIC